MGFISFRIQIRKLHLCLSEFGEEHLGKKINAFGWVKNVRKHKSVSFVDIDDGTVQSPMQVISAIKLPNE